jgi:hypothetical protein
VGQALGLLGGIHRARPHRQLRHGRRARGAEAFTGFAKGGDNALLGAFPAFCFFGRVEPIPRATERQHQNSPHRQQRRRTRAHLRFYGANLRVVGTLLDTRQIRGSGIGDLLARSWAR